MTREQFIAALAGEKGRVTVYGQDMTVSLRLPVSCQSAEDTTTVIVTHSKVNNKGVVKRTKKYVFDTSYVTNVLGPSVKVKTEA